MGRYACVTGADRGLGLEITKKLLEAGYTVFAGRYNKQLSLLDELLEEYPEGLIFTDMDVSSDAGVKAASDFISAHTGSLEVLVNNSAILGDITSTIFDPLDFYEMQKVFNTNTLGTLRVTNALMGLLVKGGKKLIMNISSEAGSIGSCWRTAWFAYCMSKAALNMQSAIVQNSLSAIGGQVIVIHPGWMKSWLSGEYQDEAPLTPDIPAAHLMEIINNCERYKGDRPAYIDYQGNRLEW